MKLAGITPDVVTFNALISAYVSGVVNGKTYDESASVLAKGHGVLTEMRSRGECCLRETPWREMQALHAGCYMQAVIFRPLYAGRSCV